MPEEVIERALRSPDDTARLAKALAPHLRSGDVILLSGGLGVGKTYLSREILHALGLPRTEEVLSPTFLLLQSYALPKMRVLHADFYRLRDAVNPENEVRRLGLEEALEEGALLLLEWGDDFEIAGDHALRIQLDRTGDSEEQRRVTLSGRLARSVDGFER
ncbi:MAG: tRNA (adenosine(37)-N6)-threonylcarbamoyltransferase complex ATPase subunit type 1 TsaE [Polyangiaceae bacterium]|nr:tRNA (adenosine(37)-N6)-threonylcarbamoyltransferase complex ATPase subunit type 1 TsaE [Polyangiaceae bacterium]